MKEPLQSALNQLIGPAVWPAAQNPNMFSDPPKQAASTVVLENPPARVCQELANEGYTRLRRFAVLPSTKAPRWLLPLGERHRLLEAFHLYMPFAPSARLMKGLVTKAIEAGWDGWGCPRVMVASKDPLPLEALATQATGEPEPFLALSLGMPGDLCKLTLQIMGRRGEILGYIKLPLYPTAVERVRNEAEVLKRLWSFPELRPHIPEVLYAGEWSGGFVLVQSPGPSRPGPLDFGPLHEGFLQLLRSIHRVERSGPALVKEVAARWRKAAPLLELQWREMGERALVRASRALQGAMIPCGIMHGDLVPWNTRVENGGLFVFDWESAAWELPALWDVFHFHVQVASLLNRRNGYDLAPAPTTVKGALFLLYVLASLSAYIEGRAPRGHQVVEYRKRLLAKMLKT
jgi:hypothetical protein